MRIIVPNAVTDATLISSSVAESDALYNPATSYSVGNIVRRDTTHRRYESLVGSNVGNTPETSPEKWLDIGPTNRWAMFDNVNTTQTSDASDIVVVIEPNGRIDGIHLNGLVASSVTVLIESGATTLYDETFSLASYAGIVDWASYWYSPLIVDTELTLLDLPTAAAATITITISGSGTRKVGTLVMGKTIDMGFDFYDASVGIQDFSRKEEDAFGNLLLVERAYSKVGSFKVRCDNDRISYIGRNLAQIRATPVVWIVTTTAGVPFNEITTIFGWVSDWRLVVALPDYSILTLEIKGLT